MIKKIALNNILRLRIKGKEDCILIPATAQFVLTNKCNLRCIYCYNDESIKNELSTLEIFRILDELQKVGTLRLLIDGGEIFLREDILKIIRYATSNLGFKVIIVTNGTLISERIVKELSKLSPPVTITITLCGSKPKIHDSITQIKDSFDRAIYGLKLSRSKGIHTVATITLLRQNADDLGNLKSLCNSLGVKLGINNILRPTICGSTRPLRYRLTESQIKNITSKRYYNQYCNEGKLEQGGLCEIGYDDLAIGADGKVYGCNMSRIEVGDLRKDDFVTIWRNSPVLARLRTIDKKDYRCSKCKYYIYCPSCIAETYILKGHYREVPREFCRLMKNNMAVKQLLE